MYVTSKTKHYLLIVDSHVIYSNSERYLKCARILLIDDYNTMQIYSNGTTEVMSVFSFVESYRSVAHSLKKLYPTAYEKMLKDKEILKMSEPEQLLAIFKHPNPQNHLRYCRSSIFYKK